MVAQVEYTPMLVQCNLLPWRNIAYCLISIIGLLSPFILAYFQGTLCPTSATHL